MNPNQEGNFDLSSLEEHTRVLTDDVNKTKRQKKANSPSNKNTWKLQHEVRKKETIPGS